MSRCRVLVHYSGRVQGVGFRYTAKQVAAGYEIVGTVRTLSDGRVELVAEGARDEVLPFTGAAHVGDLADLRVDELGEQLFG